MGDNKSLYNFRPFYGLFYFLPLFLSFFFILSLFTVYHHLIEAVIFLLWAVSHLIKLEGGAGVDNYLAEY